jgi:hypothetical protein
MDAITSGAREEAKFVTAEPATIPTSLFLTG